MSLNARSILNKLNLFQATVYELHPDIIGVTESWANNSILNSELHLDGYQLFRCDRKTGNRGGGVLLYINEALNPTEYHIKAPYCEHIWCQIGDLLVGVCYRSTNVNVVGQDNEINLINVLREVSTKHVLIMGDFNYADIDWASNTTASTSGPSTIEFLHTVEDCFLTQHVLNATRDDVILDLILTSDPELVSDVRVLDCMGTSDHNMVSFSLHHEQTTLKNKRQVRDYCRGDYDSIRAKLSTIDWDLLISDDMDNSWEAFKQLLLDLEAKFIPEKNIVNNSRLKKPIWMTHKALRCVKNKTKVFRKYKDRHHPAVMKANKSAHKELRLAKRNFERRLADNIKHDAKSFFAYARSKAKVKVQIRSVTGTDGTPLDSEKDITESFNNYFTSVFTREDQSRHTESTSAITSEGDAVLSDLNIDIDTVIKALSKLRPDKSMGPDNLSPKLLIETQKEIAYPLLLLFRNSLQELSVPDDWKKANVSPIFKKGNRQSLENYRPVSLTSQICKLFETVIRDAMVSHLESKHLISDSQHGFRKGRSCLTNLLEFLDKVTGCVDSGDCVDVIFLDFAKAFDKVPHGLLIRKLKAHGIDGKLLGWITEWLKNRRQRVCVRGITSSWAEVLSGVPQGSVLGPILFLIYINDLEFGIRNWILKFADDTKIFSRVNSIADRERLQNDLDKLISWSEEWQMLFNISKCKVMHIGKSKLESHYFMKNQQLETVCQEKDLGVMITNDLKVSQQCQQAYNKASRILGLINRTIEYRHKNILLRLYKSLVRPHLEYCVPAWSPHYNKDKILLERIQHRFTRMIPDIKNLQ